MRAHGRGGQPWPGDQGVPSQARAGRRPAATPATPEPPYGAKGPLSCFEELDRELCEPKIRAFMEQQVRTSKEMKRFSFTTLFLYLRSLIASGETEKNRVVN